MLKKISFVFIIFVSFLSTNAQKSTFEIVDYSNPKKYVIADIQIEGIKYLDASIIIGITGLAVGDEIEIPGSKISNAIEILWRQQLFSDVKIVASKIEGKNIHLKIYLQEQPRLASVEIKGIRKGQVEDLMEKLNLRPGNQVTDNVIEKSINIIKNHFIEKGFYYSEITHEIKNDTLQTNAINLTFNVNKKDRIKIEDIVFEGNEVYSDAKLRRLLKNTKKVNWNIFKPSKYRKDKLEEDYQNVITKYNEDGYRDARITGDSLWYSNEHERLMLKISVNEGKRYYFGNIKWVGNTKYPADYLNFILKISKGDHYDQTLLNNRLFVDEDAVSSLYMDKGYLFFNLTPVEAQVNGDSIDLEMRISEGEPATINRVIVLGNDRVHDHVIRREIKTRPGELFSRSDIIRTQRELAQLGYFDPEQLGIDFVPQMEDGTVDLKYTLVERANDQLEIAGGWGADMLVGTIGVRFSNFSLSRIFDKTAWRPVPTGDGQTLSIRAQSNGSYYKMFNLTFVEPWLGGKKPNSFSFSAYHTINNISGTSFFATSDQSLKITGASVGLGRRLNWPDDFFTIYNSLTYQRYNLENWTTRFAFSDGVSNNFSFTTVLGRNSVDSPIFPRSGSDFSLTLKFTPPYSLMNNKDYADPTMPDTERYKWVEYHKWVFKSSVYQRIVENLVFMAKAEFGMLGRYNKNYGYSPFEGFVVGGDGLAGYDLYGSDYIGLRGYENHTVSPQLYTKSGNLFDAGRLYDKVTLEVRYPISLNPQASIYALAFLEGGNAWTSIDEFNPFELKRSAGAGLRVFLPMLGMLGVDWGYGFDTNNRTNTGEISGGQFHFIIGQQF